MSLIIESPDTRAPERDYILSVILGEFLGLDWQRVPSDRTDTRITLQGHQGEILMPDTLLQTPDKHWLTAQSLPSRPLPVWDTTELGLPITLIDPKLPIIYGTSLSPTPYPLLHNPLPPTPYPIIHIPVDVFSSAFFMLTRYEEVVKPDRDNHDRFPATASLAFQEGFLDRPIIDEYVEVLWAVMKNLWPGLERKDRTYQVFLSHDVDSVLYGPFASPLSLFKQMAGDIIKRKDLALARRRADSFFSARRGHFEDDPYNTFEFIMDCSERHGLKSAFYFMTGGNTPRDAKYDINMPWVKKLMRTIGERGHEVGLHPSYDTYLDPKATSKEFQTLLQVAEKCGIRQDAWGGRQHCLRWHAKKTWKNWDKTGLAYDSTLTFAQQAGFRAGTSFEYPVFDIASGTALKLRERPLIVMEGTLFNKGYMGLNQEKSSRIVEKLSKTCKLVQGNFVLLWHNSKLDAKSEKLFYVEQVKNVTNKSVS
jgi:hypothetical protein